MSEWVGMKLWQWPRWAHYVLAIGVSLLAILSRFYYRDKFGDEAPFTISTLAVLIAAFAGGFRPGLAASAISMIFAVFLFIEPEGWVEAHTRSIVVTVAVWVSMSYICGMLRHYAMQNEALMRERQAEQAQLAATMDSITDGFLSVDEEGTVRRANTAAAEMLGRSQEIVGLAIENVVEALHSPDLKDKMAVVRNDQVSVRLDVPNPKTGRWYHLRLYPSERRGLVIFMQDITDRKELEVGRDRMLSFERTARSSAEQASRLKDEFLATLSHELRTPLTTLLGWLELIEARETMTGSMREGFDAIQRSSKRLTKLIDELLDLSRINAGKIRLDFREIKAADLVVEAIAAVQPLAEENGIDLRSDIRNHGACVRGDSSRLHQICGNLLNNALKFTPRGGSITVTLDANDQEVTISVADTGEGIEPSAIPLIFERFRQADGKLARSHQGLGLGLAIVDQLVRLHGGRIEADSEGVGKGATFTVRLPLAEIAERTADTRTVLEPIPAPIGLDGVRIMLVDDDDSTRQLLQVVLAESGADVMPCTSAQQALKELETVMPDVILSDIGMPEMDGYQFMATVREKFGGPDVVPAIAVTAFGRSEDRDQSLAVGFQSHLTRPVRRLDLIGEISRVLDRSAAGR